MKLSKLHNQICKWSRFLHRDLSFFFSGMILIYAISGFVMNHLDSINPNFTIKQQIYQVSESVSMPEKMNKQDVINLLSSLDIKATYTKHYTPAPKKIKVFLKGGSVLLIDTSSREVVYQHQEQRPVLSRLTRLHYNPGKGWTYFSDAFAISLVLITITGLIMLKGPKGLKGRGGIEFAIGIAIPLLFLFL